LDGPLAGIIGAGVTASWAYGLIQDAGAVLLDMKLDRGMGRLRKTIESDGDRLADLHLWRLGTPGTSRPLFRSSQDNTANPTTTARGGHDSLCFRILRSS
jgi:Co/Zn/Cd efflux system component